MPGIVSNTRTEGGFEGSFAILVKKILHSLVRRSILFPEKSRSNLLSRFLIKVLSIDSWLEAIHWFFIPDREWIKQQYSVKLPREIYSHYLFHPILYLINAMRVPHR